MTKQIAQTLCAALSGLTLVIGCAGPTAETIATATSTPTSAAATATPASATATAAPPTETPTPTPIPVTFEIINDAGNPAQDVDYQQLLAARLQITETVAFAAYHVGDVASLVLLAGEPRDKVTGVTIQPLTRLLAAENELLPLCCPELLALTAANGGENVLLAKTDGKELAISGLILYTNGEHYAIIQKDDGSVVLKNYLDQDSPDAPECLLEIDPDNSERLVTYINNSPIYIPTAWQEPIALDEAGDLFINPFEVLKAEYVIGNNAEFAQLPEYIQLPNGWQIFEFQGTLTNRNTMDIFSNGIVAFGPNGEVFVANNNIDWSKVTDPGIGYAMSLKTDENQNPIADPFNDNSFTLIATFLGDPEEPALVWHPEGGEDDNEAWVEEEQEYATAMEALMTLFEKEPTYQYQNLTAYASKDWEQETGYPQSVLQEKEGIEPGAFGKAILDVLKPAAIANGIAAIDLEDNQIKIFNMTTEEFDDHNFKVFVDVDESDSPVLLPPNAQEITRLDLFIRMRSGEQLKRVGIFFDQKSSTFFVYIKIKPGMYNSPKENRRKDSFSGNITTAGALLATKPADVLYADSHRVGDSSELHREQADKMLLIIRALFKSGEQFW